MWKILKNSPFPCNLGVLIIGFEHDEFSLDWRETTEDKE